MSRIIIEVRGGLVSSVKSNNKLDSVDILDYDVLDSGDYGANTKKHYLEIEKEFKELPHLLPS